MNQQATQTVELFVSPTDNCEKMEKVINAITMRIHKLDEIIEKRERIFKTEGEDETTKAYSAGCYNSLYNEVEFLGLLLADVEEL